MIKRMFNLLPERVKDKFRRIKECLSTIVLLAGDGRRFNRYAALSGSVGREQLATKIIFFSHQIEKGLSHSDFRVGFGKRPITILFRLLQEWRKYGYPDDFVLKLAYGVLRNYELKHRDCNVSLPYFYEQGAAIFHKEIESADVDAGGVAGYFPLEQNRLATYSAVVNRRCSIREFLNKPIENELIEDAVRISLKAPSVCNRQPQRIRVITNTRLIHEALVLQGGWNGYSDPPALILVTASLPSFVHPVERNEPYVDGGIFSMALLGALEERGIAACPLNTMFGRKVAARTRKLLSIPDEEVFIMYIAVGYAKAGVLHPRSLRKPLDDVLTYLR